MSRRSHAHTQRDVWLGYAQSGGTIPSGRTNSNTPGGQCGQEGVGKKQMEGSQELKPQF